MNIKDLQPGSYKVVTPQLNINNLPQGSYKTASSAFPTSEPETVKKSFVQKLGSFGNALGNIVGGNKMGEYLGTKIAEHSPNAKALREVMPEYQDKSLFQTPTGKQIAGDVLKAGTTIATAALPGAGSLLGKTIEGAALGYGMDVSQKLTDQEDKAFKPGAGTVIGASLPFASKLVGALLKKGVAFSTGAGPEVIQRAIDNPDSVSTAIKEFAKTPEAQHSLVSRAKAAIYDFLGDRGQEYGQSVAQMTSKQPLSKQVVVDEFAKQVDKFGGKVKNGQLVFKDSQLTTSDVNNLKKAWSSIAKWSDVTPQGFDRLRQSIGNYMQDFKAVGNPRANVVLGRVKDTLTKHMESNIDDYAKTLSTYGTKTKVAQDLLAELSQKTGTAKPSTQLNQILRLFKKDPTVRESLVKVMGEKEANQFLDDVSGAILSEWLPTGKVRGLAEGALELGGGLVAHLAGASNPAIAAGIVGTTAASSPRIVGKALTTGSKAIKKGIGTAAKRIITKTASQTNH